MLLPASLWGYGPQLCLMPLDPHLTRSPQPTSLLLCRLQLMADVPSSCDKKLTATGGGESNRLSECSQEGVSFGLRFRGSRQVS